jgi:hypothetical protein
MAKKHGKARAGAKAIGKGMLAAAGFLAKRATIWGVAAQYGEEMLAEHSETVQNKWYAGPAAILAGAVVARKKPDTAKALAGAAGYAGGLKYKFYQFQNGKRDQSPMHYWNFKDDAAPAGKPAAAAPAAGAQGYEDDTGLRSDAALFN